MGQSFDDVDTISHVDVADDLLTDTPMESSEGLEEMRVAVQKASPPMVEVRVLDKSTNYAKRADKSRFTSWIYDDEGNVYVVRRKNGKFEY